jgi:hypothetical protein
MVDHVVWAFGAVTRVPWRRDPHAVPIRPVPAVGDRRVLFDPVLVGPARVPLGVAVVEGAFADHIATGRPIETGCVTGLKVSTSPCGR